MERLYSYFPRLLRLDQRVATVLSSDIRQHGSTVIPTMQIKFIHQGDDRTLTFAPTLPRSAFDLCCMGESAELHYTHRARGWVLLWITIDRLERAWYRLRPNKRRSPEQKDDKMGLIIVTQLDTRGFVTQGLDRIPDWYIDVHVHLDERDSEGTELSRCSIRWRLCACLSDRDRQLPTRILHLIKRCHHLDGFQPREYSR